MRRVLIPALCVHDVLRSFAYKSDAVCPELALTAADAYLDLGHKVKAMISWVAAHITSYDFLLKTDVDTLICFSMVTDMERWPHTRPTTRAALLRPRPTTRAERGTSSGTRLLGRARIMGVRR